MDGQAISEAFASQAGPDCLRDVLPKYGQRIKVYTALKAVIMVEMEVVRDLWLFNLLYCSVCNIIYSAFTYNILQIVL